MNKDSLHQNILKSMDTYPASLPLSKASVEFLQADPEIVDTAFLQDTNEQWLTIILLLLVHSAKKNYGSFALVVPSLKKQRSGAAFLVAPFNFSVSFLLFLPFLSLSTDYFLYLCLSLSSCFSLSCSLLFYLFLRV